MSLKVLLKRNGNLILLLALVNLLLSPIYYEIFGTLGNIFVPVNYVLVILGSFLVCRYQKNAKVVLIMGILLAIIILMESIYMETREIRLLRAFFILGFFILILFNVMKHLSKIKSVEIDQIWAAVSGYMLIAFTGGAIYEILHYCVPNSFQFQSDFTDFQLYYFSFTGTTTVGFGDIVPNTEVAQSLTMLINIAASLYLAIVMAFFVGKYLKEK